MAYSQRSVLSPAELRDPNTLTPGDVVRARLHAQQVALTARVEAANPYSKYKGANLETPGAMGLSPEIAAAVSGLNNAALVPVAAGEKLGFDIGETRTNRGLLAPKGAALAAGYGAHEAEANLAGRTAGLEGARRAALAPSATAAGIAGNVAQGANVGPALEAGVDLTRSEAERNRGQGRYFLGAGRGLELGGQAQQTTATGQAGYMGKLGETLMPQTEANNLYLGKQGEAIGAQTAGIEARNKFLGSNPWAMPQTMGLQTPEQMARGVQEAERRQAMAGLQNLPPGTSPETAAALGARTFNMPFTVEEPGTIGQAGYLGKLGETLGWLKRQVPWMGWGQVTAQPPTMQLPAAATGGAPVAGGVGRGGGLMDNPGGVFPSAGAGAAAPAAANPAGQGFRPATAAMVKALLAQGMTPAQAEAELNAMGLSGHVPQGQ